MIPKVLFVGGARSGKSRLAQSYVEETGLAPLLYVATLQVQDKEMAERVALHQQMRGSLWKTIETGASLGESLQAEPEAGAVLVDSLGTWIAGLCCSVFTGELSIPQYIDEFALAVAETQRPLVIVSDEVGLGLVPETVAGRAFRDFLGLANQKIASLATDVFFVSCGLTLRLKGGGENAFSSLSAPQFFSR